MNINSNKPFTKTKSEHNCTDSFINVAFKSFLWLCLSPRNL